MVRRTALCLGCRTALASGERCDVCDGAEVVELTDGAGRARAREFAWRIESRREVRAWLSNLLVAVLGVGGLVAVIAVTIVSVKSDWGIFPLDVIGGTVLWVASWALIVWIPERLQRTVLNRCPNGAQRDARPPAAGGHTGEVVASREVVVVAFELRHGDAVMFRDATCTGFELVDGATRIVVPEGRVRVSLGAARGEDVRPRWSDYAMSAGLAAEIVPHGSAKRWLLRSGDRVRIHATLEDSLNGDASYRAQAPRTRRAVGVAWLEPAGG